jgi:hypothetical protein
MKIKPFGSNQTELHLDDGTIVFFSYETPVAAHIPGLGAYYTNKKYSTTTSGHITRWLDSIGLSRNVCNQTDQSFFDKFVK